MARLSARWPRLVQRSRFLVCLILGAVLGCAQADPSLAWLYKESFPSGLGDLLWLIALPFYGREEMLYLVIGLYAWLLIPFFGHSRWGWWSGIVLSVVPSLFTFLVYFGIAYFREGDFISTRLLTDCILFAILNALIILLIVFIFIVILSFWKRKFSKDSSVQ